MDQETFHADCQNVFADLDLLPERLVAAEKVAFLEMAHHIDLPDAEDEGTITIASGTVSYTPTLDSGADIDRITSAVFVSGTTKEPLNEWGIRRHRYHYRGSGTSGVPYAFCFYADKFWFYYIPNLSGTVYFTCQQVLTDLTDFPDNYYPLMIALMKKQIYKSGSTEWYAAYRDAKDLLKSFKDRMRPKKDEMEMGRYRAERIKELNSLI